MGEEKQNWAERDSGIEASGGVGVVTDTPERGQIGAQISKFEDSPVFNYINSLSPIKPVKSVTISQTLNSLSFASLPSVFTSPHVNSFKESRFLRKHQVLDSSKPDHSSENEGNVGVNEEVTDNARNSSEEQENFDLGISVAETSFEPSYEECATLETEFSGDSPGDCDGINVPSTSASNVRFVQEGTFGNVLNIRQIRQNDQNKEVPRCDWDSLLLDASVFNHDMPNSTETFVGPSQEALDPPSFPATDNDLRESQVGSSQQSETAKPLREEGENARIGDQELHACPLSSYVAGEQVGHTTDELDSNLQRGTRRRCLVFERVGSRSKHLNDDSNYGSSMLSQFQETAACKDKDLVQINTRNDSSKCILPVIGLHLNALATTSMVHNRAVKHEDASPRRQLITAPSEHYRSLISGQDSQNRLSGSFLGTAVDHSRTGIVLEDASQSPPCTAYEELNLSSPKKKRRRLDHGGESEGCKRCKCKKSKCLKLYCECFAAGVYCVEPCSCVDCFNKPIHEDTVLATRKRIDSRNPLAFAPKVIRSSDSCQEDESSNTPASARHKRGCNCKKSGCMKKYCECYQGGVGCSINCRCEGCKNVFGLKDGSALGGSEAELEGDEGEESVRTAIDRSLKKTGTRSEANPKFAPPGTPLLFGSRSMQLPVSTKNKPMQSLLGVESSFGSDSTQRFGQQNALFQHLQKIDKTFQTTREDEMLEILHSPVSGVKSASPNSKRVSPPQLGHSLTPVGQRTTTTRKLILQSIPSFPSLTPKN